jgi:hypothetical protein
MKRAWMIRLAALSVALIGVCLAPANGKADYYPWGSYYAPSYTSYYSGYSPNYWDGYYAGGVYTAGYYPLSWSSFYSPGCCGGGCGSCSYGCGSCGGGCGSCGLSCGSCGPSCGSCGLGCGSCSVGGGSCGSGCCGSSSCGSGSCGSGLACGSGCGTPVGSDCNGTPPSRPSNKKTPPNGDDNFQPRSSQDYDDAPPARGRKKTTPETPPAGPGGGASLEGPGTDATPPGKFTRDKGADDTKAGATPAGADKFAPPVPKQQPAGGAPGEQPFGANKPVGPSPDQPAKKKAPMPNVPGADSLDLGPAGSMASSETEPDVFTSNPALALQEKATWSYASGVKAHPLAVTHVASMGSPIPRRIKSPAVELPAVRLVEKVVRN